MIRRVFVLTGAGVSAESGIATFRDRGGVWASHDLLRVATPDGFARDPEAVHAFYNKRRKALQSVEPNAAHVALAGLGHALHRRGCQLFLCTQNVDDLHERAGSDGLVHMHGELLRAVCAACGSSVVWRDDLATTTLCPNCGTAGHMRPDVVWFGEFPRRLDEIEAALAACDLFVSIGTSGEVYPAADYVEDARRAGARTCEINLEPSRNAHLFDDGLYGRAGEIVPDWVSRLFPA